MQSLFDRARDGDPNATAEIVYRLRPRLTRMVVYYARRTGEDPDDLLQEAWFGVLESLPALDTRIGSPEQHLIVRARWRMLDSVRRARIRRCAPLDDAALDSACSPNPDPADSVCVAEFLGRLKPNQRAVALCLLDGLTWREAGDRLGCTSANIAYHVRQIRREHAAWSSG